MKALVTGGGGFLGSRIVDQLLARGDPVRVCARGAYPELEHRGVSFVRGDLAVPKVAQEAVAGCDVVFHVAAKAGIAGPLADYWRANVLATLNVIDACRRAGVRKLVYTSSPSVVFDGRDMENANESVPYPAEHHGHYPRTKAEAERLVLKADGADLATVSLRPHLIWGPGDNHIVPRLIARARSGRLRRVGDGRNIVDGTYVDDAARAHLLAAAKLEPGSAVAGRAYFIASGQPIPLWELVDRILRAAGLPPVTRSVSPGLAMAAGALCEALWKWLPLPGEPPMTRFVAGELATAHWFDLSAAKRDFGYQAQVSLEEGLTKLEAWLRGPDGGTGNRSSA